MSRFSPLLSAKVFATDPVVNQKNLAIIKFPCYVSTKYDGWRMFEYDMRATCRSLKPPKNHYVNRKLAEMYQVAASIGMRGLDSEIIVGDEWDPNCMQNTSSGCNSYEGEPDFVVKLFDSYQFPQMPFTERLARVSEIVETLQPSFPFVHLAEHKLVHDMEELLIVLDDIIARGGEGVMGRDPNGHYKMGRSTMRDGILWALKPYEDDEGEIIGFAEELENQNEQTTNLLGHSERSGHKENMVPKGRLGKFICRSPNFVDTFSVGSGNGLTHALRQHVWDNRDAYLGRYVKFKYQAIGMRTRPRQPKFVGFREPEDMS